MSTLLLQLYSQNHWLADGVQTIWNFNFADGYIRRDFVKAYSINELNIKTQVAITNDMFTGPFQLQVTPAIPAGHTFVILRDTPKNAPLVNFQDGARQTELSLDTIARQATHIAAEVMDGSGQTVLLDEFGFKAMRRVTYSGSSSVTLADNGRAHYKTDGTGVTVPNTLPDELLTTIVNNSSGTMNVVFDDAVAVLQGSNDTFGKASWVLAAKNSLSLFKVEDGLWFISGKAA